MEAGVVTPGAVEPPSRSQLREALSTARMRLDVHAIVIVPCYNEESRLDVNAFRAFAIAGHRVDFTFVNDGSRDGTLRVLRELVATDPQRFSIVDFDHNRGKAEAVRRGLLAAFELKPDAVGFWDADLATPLSELPSFLDVLATHPPVEMVFGARVRLLGREISRRASRHYVGRVGATLIASSLGLAVYDTQCGAKLFRNTNAVRDVFATPFLSKWIFDVEIIARYIEFCGRDAAAKAIYELPLHVWHDVAGSKLKSHDFLRALSDLRKIHHAYKRR